MSFFKQNIPQTIPNTFIQPTNNSILQTININHLPIHSSSHVSHHMPNIFISENNDTILQTNRNIEFEKSIPSTATVYQVNQLLSELKKCQELLKIKDNTINERDNALDEKENIIKNLGNIIKNQNNTIQNQNDTIKKKDDMISKQRKMKRDIITLVSGYGFYDKKIGKAMGTFEYSAEIRKYHIHKMTKLAIGRTIYTIGYQSIGEKTFYFTNSAHCGTKLRIDELRLVEIPSKTEEKPCTKYDLKFIKCTFAKEVYDNNNNNNNCNNVIYPGDYFNVTFKHRIIQKIGKYHLSYRLYSNKKANTRSQKDSNGMFGQRIEFSYQVKGRSIRY